MTKDYLKTASIQTRAVNIGVDSGRVRGSFILMLLLLSLILPLTGCVSKPLPPPVQQSVKLLKDVNLAFTVELPETCNMSGERLGDYAIFHILCDGVQKVGIYAGNHANIDFGDKGLSTLPDIPGRKVIVRSSSEEGTVYGYFWLTQFTWPSELHIWLHEGQENDPVVRAIAESIRPTDPSTLPPESFLTVSRP